MSTAIIVPPFGNYVNGLEVRVRSLGIDIVLLKLEGFRVKAAILSLTSRNKSETSAVL
jgi:hypothetical protein